MIASVSGIVLQGQGDTVVIEVGGIGLLIQCPASTAATVRVGETMSLATVLVVREDALTLYGFADAQQREVFQLVQSVTGIGPRTALAVVSTMTVDQLRQAIAAEDLASITRIPGIGRKGAQRMVLELKDSLGVAANTDAVTPATAEPWRTDVQAGLESLGWNPRQASWAVAEIADDPGLAPGEEADIAALLKAALQRLNRSI
ncbi:MAG: Holliday junction branch migration protein RuvA [Candidatus Nanopelagicales bacterium]